MAEKVSKDKEKHLRTAEKYASQGKFAKAIEEYLKIIRFDPKDVPTLNTIGDLYTKIGRTDEAVRHFLQIAEHYSQMGFYLKAIAVYKKLIGLEPENLDLAISLGDLYAKQGLNVEARNQYLGIAEQGLKAGRFEISVKACQKVLEVDPQNVEVHLKLAQFYVREKDASSAKRALNDAAQSLIKQGRHTEALQVLKKALEMEAPDAQTLANYVDACAENPEHLDRHLLDELAQAHPEDPAFLEALGQGYFVAGDPERSEELFLRLIKLDPGRYSRFFSLAAHHLEQGHLAASLRQMEHLLPILGEKREEFKVRSFLEEAQQQFPDDLALLTLWVKTYHPEERDYRKTLWKLLEAYGRAGKIADAFQCAEQLLGLEPSDASYRRKHQELFCLLYPGRPYDAGDEQEAAVKEEAREEALPPQPPVPASIDDLDSLLLEVDIQANRGYRLEAMRRLREILEKHPDSLDGHLRLKNFYLEEKLAQEAALECETIARVLEQQGEYAEGERYLNEALRLRGAAARPAASELVFEPAEFGLQLGPDAREKSPAGSPAEAPAQTGPSAAAQAAEHPRGDLEWAPSASAEFSSGEDLTQLLMTETLEQEPSAEPSQEATALEEAGFFSRMGFEEEARKILEAALERSPGSPVLLERIARLSSVPTESIPQEVPGWEEVSSPAIDEEALPADSQVPGSEEAVQLPTLEEAESVLDSIFKDTAPTVPTNVRFFPSKPAGPESEAFEVAFSAGLAYQEMGLWDDAMGRFQEAFQVAATSAAFLRCCHMLALCWRSKGEWRKAVGWYQEGLKRQGGTDYEYQALRYELGEAYLEAGERDLALVCFREIYAWDPKYRDVAARIFELTSKK